MCVCVCRVWTHACCSLKCCMRERWTSCLCYDVSYRTYCNFKKLMRSFKSTFSFLHLSDLLPSSKNNVLQNMPHKLNYRCFNPQRWKVKHWLLACNGNKSPPPFRCQPFQLITSIFNTTSGSPQPAAIFGHDGPSLMLFKAIWIVFVWFVFVLISSYIPPQFLLYRLHHCTHLPSCGSTRWARNSPVTGPRSISYKYIWERRMGMGSDQNELSSLPTIPHNTCASVAHTKWLGMTAWLGKAGCAQIGWACQHACAWQHSCVWTHLSFSCVWTHLSFSLPARRL